MNKGFHQLLISIKKKYDLETKLKGLLNYIFLFSTINFHSQKALVCFYQNSKIRFLL